MTAFYAPTAKQRALLIKVLHFIDTHPGKWVQGAWFSGRLRTEDQKQAYDKGDTELCGTTACVAGWAMLKSGQFVPLARSREIVDLVRVADNRHVKNDLAVDDVNFYIHTGGALLGLNEEQAIMVFVHTAYDSRCPHTFTDTVRAYLDIPVKWGTVVQIKGVHRWTRLLKQARHEPVPHYSTI